MSNYTLSWNYEDSLGDTLKEKSESLMLAISKQMPYTQIIVKTRPEVAEFITGFAGRLSEDGTYFKCGRFKVFLDETLSSDVIFGDEYDSDQFELKILHFPNF